MSNAPNTFGVTHQTLRSQKFPHLSDFSANSAPDSSTVTVFIGAQAARLDGKIRAEGLDPAGITDATSSAYLRCQDVITTAAAVKTMQAMVQQDPELLKAWRQEVADFYKDLSTSGYLALGAGVSAPEQESDGPNDHIDGNALETEDTDDISPVLHKLRVRDLL